MTKKILITGSREFSSLEVMSAALDECVPLGEPVIIIHGTARGADTMADRLAVASPWATVVRVPADWENHQPWEAGPLRNGHMLDLGPDLVLAFYKTGAKNAGTQNCVDQARARGIEVRTFSE